MKGKWWLVGFIGPEHHEHKAKQGPHLEKPTHPTPAGPSLGLPKPYSKRLTAEAPKSLQLGSNPVRFTWREEVVMWCLVPVVPVVERYRKKRRILLQNVEILFFLGGGMGK